MFTEDVAKYLKVSDQYARRIMKSGKIRSEFIEGNWITSREEVKKFIINEEYVINPDDRKRLSNKLPNIVALSFFSGGMGLDIGMNNSGIKPLLACEVDKNARATIIKNNKEIALVGDIWKCNAEKIRKFARIPKNRKIDVIFGGPPCQAFSTAGRRKGLEDARGDVFIKYIDIISELKPRYAVIENVRGLQTTKAALKETNDVAVKGGVLYYALRRLESTGYTVSFNLYNAANFGAPQKRDRFVIIAKLGKERVPYLTPTNSEHGEYGLPLWKTLGDAILDIQDQEMHYTKIPKNRIEWFKKIPEGGNWKSLSDEDQKKAMGRKYFMGGGKTGFFRRLSFKEPSPTLVTVPTMPATDLVHPTKLRPLSVEEYARIQGFPDNWKFCGNLLEQYKQIGNAVPIKLGEAIGHTILNDMNGVNNNPYKNFPYSRYKNTSETAFVKLFKNNLYKSLTSYRNEQLELSLE